MVSLRIERHGSHQSDLVAQAHIRRLRVYHALSQCQAEGQPFAAVVDYQVSFEAIEPAGRGLAPARVDREDAMLVDARRMTDRQRRRVDAADAATVPELGVQVDGQRHEHTRQQFDEARVADEARELSPQVDQHVLREERLVKNALKVR